MNCSSRNLGKNVITLYLAVKILLDDTCLAFSSRHASSLMRMVRGGDSTVRCVREILAPAIPLTVRTRLQALT